MRNLSRHRDPVQPMLFAPSELLRCGLSDAHSFPLVGRRDSDGVICASWRERPSTAWERGGLLRRTSRGARSF